MSIVTLTFEKAVEKTSPLIGGLITGFGTFLGQFAEISLTENTHVTLGPAIAVMCTAVVIGMWLKGMSDDIRHMKNELKSLKCQRCKDCNENDN